MRTLMDAVRQCGAALRTSDWWYRKADKALDGIGDLAAIAAVVVILLKVHPLWLKLLLLPLAIVVDLITPFLALSIALVVGLVASLPYHFFATLPRHAEEHARRTAGMRR